MTYVSARMQLKSAINNLVGGTRVRQQLGLEEVMLPLGHSQPVVRGFAQDRPVDSVTVSKVTNLNAEGAGSFQAALGGGNTTSDHLVVFEVGGIVEMSSKSTIQVGLTIARNHNGFRTLIAGETAPDPGITVKSNTLDFVRGSFRCRHVRFRTGNRNNDGFTGLDNLTGVRVDNGGTYPGRDEVKDFIFDHCSMSFGTDINFESFLGRCGRADILNSICAWALVSAGHSEGEHDGTFAGTGAQDYPHLVLGNVYAFSSDRNPFIPQSQTVVNNYAFETNRTNVHQIPAFAKEPAKVSLFANVQERGQGSSIGNQSTWGDQSHEIFYASETDKRAHLFKGVRSSAVTHYGGGTSAESFFQYRNGFPTMYPAGTRPMHPADIKRYVVKNAGARPLNRDIIDKEAIRRIEEDDTSSPNPQYDLGRINHEDDLGLDYPSTETSSRTLTVPTTQPALDKWLGSFLRHVEPQIDTTPPTSGIGSLQIRKNRMGGTGISKRSGISGT